MKEMYFVGLVTPTQWSLIGLFSLEACAVAACTTENHFIGPIQVNALLPDEIMDWEGMYFPLTEEKPNEVLTVRPECCNAD